MKILGYIYWAVLLPFAIAVSWGARLISPFACLFIVNEPYFTTVKRYGKQGKMLNRDRLWRCFAWFETDDNRVDEYWFGMYGFTAKLTDKHYYSSKIIRYICRVLWLQRNSAYTFNRMVFGLSKDSKLAWQYKGNSIIKGRTINIGFKAHKGIDRLMLAGRFI